MKTRCLIVLSVVLSILAVGCDLLCPELEYADTLSVSPETVSDLCEGGEVYYYYRGEKVFMSECRDLVFIQFADNASLHKFLSSLCGVSLLQVWGDEGESSAELKDESLNFLAFKSMAGDISEEMMRDIKESEGVLHASFFLESSGSLSATMNEVVVKLKDMSAQSFLEEMSSQYGCVVSKREWYSPEKYYLTLSNACPLSAIEFADLLYETGFFEYALPGMCYFNSFCSSDTYYSYQWNLKNTGQYGASGIDIKIEPAWTLTEGEEDIVVAVLDDGVDDVHPDLSSNLLPIYDAYYAATNTTPAFTKTHGTCVAGIIGALKDNNEGISGIAPGCRILPIRIGYSISGYDYIPYSSLEYAFNYARANADVINCSWNIGAVGASFEDEIIAAYSNGREGKGCVIVFASGNNCSNDSGSVKYPATLDRVMAVGAASYNGRRTIMSTSYCSPQWSSCYGSQLDVVAPGVSISTTDITGSGGNNNGSSSSDFSDSKYTRKFGGTSSAAPCVAGVAALILSKYPSLSESQVRRAIELGATKPTGYSYYIDDNYPSASKNAEVGYGLVNAFYALVEASTINQQRILDEVSGFDFLVTNNSSYTVDNIYVGLTGDITGSSTTLISCDPGVVESSSIVGYPLYRGEALYDSPGAVITNLTLELYANTPDYYGNVKIAAAVDAAPTVFYEFSFGDGGTYMLTLPNSTVPDSCRRTIYITITDSTN